MKRGEQLHKLRQGWFRLLYFVNVEVYFFIPVSQILFMKAMKTAVIYLDSWLGSEVFFGSDICMLSLSGLQTWAKKAWCFGPFCGCLHTNCICRQTEPSVCNNPDCISRLFHWLLWQANNTIYHLICKITFITQQIRYWDHFVVVCLKARRVWLIGYALVLILRRFSICFRCREEAETLQVGQVPGISHHVKRADQTLATIKGVQNFQPPDN